MSERSGLDILEDLLREVKLMRQEIHILDQNIKHVANSAKRAELAVRGVSAPIDVRNKKKAKAQIEAVVGDIESKKQKNMRFGFEKTSESVAQDNSMSFKPTKCMCHGVMTVSDGENTIGVSKLDVKIFDSKDELVAQTRTNAKGEWRKQLPDGKYIANIEGKFRGKELYPVNLMFEVKPNMKDLEVK